MNKFEELVDYRLVPHSEDENLWAVEILLGKYKGLAFNYDSIRIDTKNDRLMFTLTIFENIINNPINPDEDVEFQNFAADLLRHIVEKSFEEDAIHIKDPEENPE